METRKTSLLPEQYYHIYNRGNNGETIFFEEKNYHYFLQKFSQYVHPFVETYAYCLLGNHFHLLIKVKSEEEIRNYLDGRKANSSASWHVSNAFGSLFKSYAQAINKQYSRTGALFEEPFHRIQVVNQKYLTNLVYYIHHNPVKHGFVKDFKEYPYSSYHSHLLTQKTKLEREKVIGYFGGRNKYEEFHGGNQQIISDLIIEF